MKPGIVLPVKRFDGAKNRLSPVLDREQRRTLMEAMLADVLAALGRLHTSHVLVVVTSEPGAADRAAAIGATVVSDPDEPGHSPAAAHGISVASALGATRVLLLAGDCPLVKPGAVDALLAPAPARGRRVVLVSDRTGEGTNALLLEPPDAIRPAFGPGSHERHAHAAVRSGASFESVDLPSLALDVDTPVDLAALKDVLRASPGAAPRTAAALDSLGLMPRLAR